MSEAMTLADVLKFAPTAQSLSNLSMLLVNSSGNISKFLGWPIASMMYLGNIADLDETGIYAMFPETTGLPVTDTAGSFLIHLQWDHNAAFQLLFCYIDQTPYFRGRQSSVWRPWRKLAFAT